MKYLILGGTGFLGTALVYRLLGRDDVEEIRVYSRDELKQSEMARRINDKRVTYHLGDIRNLERLKEAIKGVDIIIHTAALKRMDTISHNAYEVIDVNVNGTRNVMLAAEDRKVIFVSTDKAFQPTCLYGASKMCAEGIVLANPKAVTWRFGNFKWSRGSVWTIFEEQRDAGLPLTVTDPEATRFVMDIEKVCDYILSPAGPGLNIPLNLKAMTVGDIAREFAPEILWKVVGLREGEKKHEAFDENYSSDKCL